QSVSTPSIYHAAQRNRSLSIANHILCGVSEPESAHPCRATCRHACRDHTLGDSVPAPNAFFSDTLSVWDVSVWRIDCVSFVRSDRRVEPVEEPPLIWTCHKTVPTADASVLVNLHNVVV